MFIPKRFQNMVNTHLLGNMLDIPEYPLMMAIVGRPGMGKTLQLRSFLERSGIKVFSISSADLESDLAGAPAKLLKSQYVKASVEISMKRPAVLVIDDIDTTVGEWEQNTGTVNHQGILAFLMHLADNPCYIEGIGATKRVPVFLTGNRFELLYEPLRRPGRMYHFEWEPNVEEKIKIVREILDVADERIAERLVKNNPEQSISFFSSLYSTQNMKIMAAMAENVDYFELLTNRTYKSNLQKLYEDSLSSIDWDKL